MNDWERLHRQAEEYKESYPPGTRVMLLHMNDPYHPVDDGMINLFLLYGLSKKTMESSTVESTVALR
jgi:hypothetical protein